MPAQSKENKKQSKKSVAIEEDSDAEDLCFICTEAIITFAVADCEHRTCHRCALRLRALYETQSCAYCKAEETVAVFTKSASKPFAEYAESNTPFADKKLGIKFETQEMYKEAMDMMKYNCPEKDCTECCKDWGNLKLHVRKEHNLNLCDICIKHKKVFPFEHTLYTTDQLMEHHQKGDKGFIKEDETGFSGHPECQFCKTRFFGNDELYIHCRDNHEQCFLCVREGVRHEYYINYTSLEDHFKRDHYMCLYPQCLEKKFVVFGSSIDLVGHEAETHGGNTSGLQRCMQTEARRVELNFQYSTFRPARDNEGRRNTRNNENTSNNATPSVSDFPSIQDTPTRLQQRLVPGAPSRNKGKQKAVRKPTGFGALSDRELPSTTYNVNTTSVAPPVIASHTAFLTKLEDMLQSKKKVAEFRKTTGAFRKGEMDANTYVSQIVAMTDGSVEKSSKIFKGVETLLDIEAKKLELIKAWRNKHTAMIQFPALEIKPQTPSNKVSRVLVIKNTKPVKKINPKSPWEKPSVPSPSSSGSSRSELNRSESNRSSPTFAPTTPALLNKSSKKASGSQSNSRSLESNAFPSLPTPAPKHQEILNMRRNTYQPNQNAWGGSVEQEESITQPSTDKKKKGRKNKVLLRVGL